MKKNLFTTVSGLLIGITLFSCAKDEISGGTTDTIIETQAITTDLIVDEILNTSINAINIPADDSGVLKASNSSNLTFEVDEFCGFNEANGNQLVCTTDFFEIGGFTENSITDVNAFPRIPNPYTSNALGTGAAVLTDSGRFIDGRVQFIDPNTDLAYFRLEIPTETNDIIGIFLCDPIICYRAPREIFLNTPADVRLSRAERLRFSIRDFNTDRTVLNIGNLNYIPSSNILTTESFNWKIPSSLPTGEYYLYMEDIEDPSIHTDEQYITKIVHTNNGETTDVKSRFSTNEANSIITSPVTPDPLSVASVSGTLTEAITIEWDPTEFNSLFLRLAVAVVDIDTSPRDVTFTFGEWVINTGSYTLPIDTYNTRNYGVILLSDIDNTAQKNFNLANFRLRNNLN